MIKKILIVFIPVYTIWVFFIVAHVLQWSPECWWSFPLMASGFFAFVASIPYAAHLFQNIVNKERDDYYNKK